jgi:hypothetical protein
MLRKALSRLKRVEATICSRPPRAATNAAATSSLALWRLRGKTSKDPGAGMDRMDGRLRSTADQEVAGQSAR